MTRRTRLAAEPLEDRLAPAVYAPDTREPTSPPEGKVVRISAQFPNGEWYGGTGALVGHNHVLTAGHVVHSAAAGGAATRIVIEQPDQTSGNVYAAARVTALRVAPGWTASDDFTADWALVTTTKTENLGTHFGWFVMRAPEDAAGVLAGQTTVRTTGYPGDRNFHQYTTTGTVSGATGTLLSSFVDAAPGQSGSPLYSTAGVNDYTYGVLSHGPTTGNTPNAFVRLTPGLIAALQGYIADDRADFAAMPAGRVELTSSRPGRTRVAVSTSPPPPAAETIPVPLPDPDAPADPPPAVAPPADLAEGNAADWTAAAESGTATVADDFARTAAGTASVRLDTDGGFDTVARFAAPAGGWDVTGFDELHVSLYAENPNVGFQQGSPWLVLTDLDGNAARYQYVVGGEPFDLLNDARGAWRSYSVPLAAGADAEFGWRRTDAGAFDPARVAAVEVHADTWDTGFSLWIDDLGFRAGAGPTVVVAQAPEQPDPTADPVVRFVVTFSEPVVGFTADDLDLGGRFAEVSMGGDGREFVVALTIGGAAGPVTLTVPAGSATDAAGNPSAASAGGDDTVTYQPGGTLAIGPDALPGATTGFAYTAPVFATGAVGGVNFAVAGGGLPDGLSLWTNGVLTGVPARAGEFAFAVTAVDAAGNAAARTYTMRVADPLGVAPADVPAGRVGAAYRVAFEPVAATRPAAEYHFHLIDGMLPPGLVLHPDGELTGTPLAAGSHAFAVRVVNAVTGDTATAGYTLAVTAAPAPEPEPEPQPDGELSAARPLAIGGAASGAVRVVRPDGSATSMSPFGATGTATRTASADVNGDGVADVIAATGPGTPLRVAVLSGGDGSVLVAPFDPFGGNFVGGGYVAAADLDGDGRAEFAVTPDEGGGPRVCVFGLAAGRPTVRANFFGIDDANFRGGARAALGDVNGDGTPDVVVAAGFGGGPRTAIFTGQSVLAGAPARLVGDFFAFPGADATSLRNGSFVAAGDVTGDGFADLVFGGGPGGAPRVFVLSGALVAAGNVAGAQATPVENFFVGGDLADRGGARVAVGDVDGDAKADLVVGSGAGRPAAVKVYPGRGFAGGGEPDAIDLDPFGGAVLTDGVFVG